MRHLRNNAVAWVALFVALGGTSVAARHYVVSSTSQIKPSVLQAIERVQNRTVTVETSTCVPTPCGYHAVPGPQGDRGVEGPKGVQGVQGVTGPPGPRGCNPAGLGFAGVWKNGGFYKIGNSTTCENDENTVLVEDPEGSHEWWRCAHSTVVRNEAVGCTGGPPSERENEWERIF